jgi:hypothetical protein
LYLNRDSRLGWKESVIFVEPSTDPSEMVVVSVWMIPLAKEFDYRAVTGGTLAVLDLDELMSVHVVATHEPSVLAEGVFKALASDVAAQSDSASLAQEHPTAVVLAHGTSRMGVKFFLPLPLHSLLPGRPIPRSERGSPRPRA